MFNYLLYRLGQYLAMHLPLKLAYALAVFCSDVHYIFADQDRRFVKGNLRIIFPDKPLKEIYRIRREMARNFAKYLADFFRFEKIDAAYIKKNVRIENIRYFDQALAKGKGVIILTAHLGNWELGGVVIALSGYPFWAVALKHKNKRVDDFFNNQRESKGPKVIPLGRAVRKCLSLLKENKIIALLGDRDFTERGIVLDFFDRKALFPEGPAAFALQTGASIVPGFLLRNKDDSFTLRIEPPIEFIQSGDKKRDLPELILKYKAIIEGYIREYPEQWYMFKKFSVN
ncbi:MAG: lysophospholipid acyltransferase family protein [Candidatus Omnitrophota bacterium]|nr:lysophospholipid acyltransferase family protein [Candidatus Omnitrophota bacterium]